MQKFIGLFIAFSVLLSACRFPSGGAPAVTAAPPASDTPVFSLVDTAAPEPTKTLTPTSTLIPDSEASPNGDTLTPNAPTGTPLPTIPTFTPTFDARTIVTATPAPKAECPKENPEIVPDFPDCDATGCSGGPYSEATLNYLNSGGTLDKLESKKWGNIIDLTGDSLKEVIFAEGGKLFIFGCNQSKVKILGEIEGTQNTPSLDEIRDLNKNGLPELLVSNYERGAFRSIQIFEWNGTEFRSLILNHRYDSLGKIIDFDWTGGTGFDYRTTDVNGDGLKEIIAINEIPFDPGYFAKGLPWRDMTVTVGWNGQNYIVVKEEYTSPQYRFQAIQDADRLTRDQDYDKALLLYQNAIFNNRLDWWSKDRKSYERATTLDRLLNEMWGGGGGGYLETTTPDPTPPAVKLDPTEYPRLAAYAYYRMVILHTFLGEMDAAQVKYATLQEKFPVGNPAHPYVEMATDFWNAYQSSGQMYNACAAAIAYADAHPEILIPLGSDYHGAQSHTYIPADVCPFR